MKEEKREVEKEDYHLLILFSIKEWLQRGRGMLAPASLAPPPSPPTRYIRGPLN